MDKFDRIYALTSYIKQRRTPVTLEQICDRLECSKSTAKRTIEYSRNFLNVPLVYDQSVRGYRLETSEDANYELPGLWFNDSELFALLLSQQLLTDIQPGLLEEQIQPIRSRLDQLLANKHLGGGDLQKRIRILQTASRPTDMENFRHIVSALVQKKRLKMLYHGRQSDQTTERTVSSQRIVYYQDNWYLDAWCHLRDELRTFSIDRIHPICILDDTNKEMKETELDELLTTSYGIFSGSARHTAKLKFSPEAARWVADEPWHPDQTSTTLKDGSIELQIPYNNPTELIRDILKYGSDVIVISPVKLRNAIKETIKTAYEQY